MSLRPLLTTIVLILIAPAAADDAGVVEGLQAPAWIERHGAVAPVAPGMVLKVSDRLRTGGGGRLLLRLAEGSQVKLGENARFELARLDPPAARGGFFSGLMEVAKGAFRFTTTLLSRSHRRRLDIRVSAVTAGIRGTDLWGKSKPDEDIVCLIEGAITVGREDAAPVTLSEPLSFYVAPRDAPPKPVGNVSREQLAKWALETELTPDQGIITATGPWTGALASLRDRERAVRALRGAHAAGLPARIAEVEVAGATWYRIVVTGFVSRSEALAFGHRPLVKERFPDAWVYRQP